MKLRPVCLALLTWIIIGGCASYTVGNETFLSREAADQKFAQTLSAQLKDIPLTQTPVHGSALIALPTTDEIQRFCPITGSNLELLTKSQLKDMINHFNVTTAMGLNFMADAIKKRMLFDAVDVTYSPIPSSVPLGDHNYLIYLDVDGWYVKGKGSAQSWHVQQDAGKAGGVSLVISSLDSIEKITREIPRSSVETK